MDIYLLRRGVADQAALVRLVEQCAAIGYDGSNWMRGGNRDKG
jgi:hypothetical protein